MFGKKKDDEYKNYAFQRKALSGELLKKQMQELMSFVLSLTPYSITNERIHKELGSPIEGEFALKIHKKNEILVMNYCMTNEINMKILND